MSLDIGTLVARIQVDSTGAPTGLAKAETQLSAQARKTGEKAGRSLGAGITSSLKAGLGIAAGFVAFKGVTSFIDSSIDAAKELNESVARSETVFGKSTTAVQHWADSTDKSLGLSKQAALEYTAQLGNVYEQIGFTSKASADLAEKTTTLAVQIGAFKNADPSQVLLAIQAGYRGQLRALQRLVPGITTAQVQQEALNETGKTNVKTLTAQEKATALLTVVQRDSTKATTFYNGEAGKLNRNQKQFNAELDNLKAKLGEDAIPLLTKLSALAANDLIPALNTAGHDIASLASGFGSLPSPIQGASAGLLTMTLLGPKIKTLSTSIGSELRTSLDGVRLSMMYAADEAGTTSTRLSRLTSVIGAGAGAGLRGASSGLLDILGGPWGVAFLGASAAVGFLVSKYEKGKAQVADFTKAIEADSGALGANTRAAVVNALSQGDTFKQAKTLGISLSDLTDDLLGNADAQARVNAILAKYPSFAASGNTGVSKLGLAATQLSATLGNTGNALHTATTKAKDYASALGAIPGDVSTNVSINTKQAVAQERALQSLISRTTTALQKQSGVGGKSTIGSANGNIFYAGGGENHTAQIGNGVTRVWNEPETGGEAYIPLGMNKRTRSTAILADVASRFGMGGMGGPQIGSLLTVENWSPGISPDQAADRMAFRLGAHGIG